VEEAIRGAAPLPRTSIGPLLVVGIIVLASTGLIAIVSLR
jgi:hypothetical protein